MCACASSCNLIHLCLVKYIYKKQLTFLSFLSKAMASRHFINSGMWYITTLPTVRLHYPSLISPLIPLCCHFSLSFLCSTTLRSFSCFSPFLLHNNLFIYIFTPPSYLMASTTVITLKGTARKEIMGRETLRDRGRRSQHKPLFKERQKETEKRHS